MCSDSCDGVNVSGGGRTLNGPISLEGHFKVNLTLAKVKSVKVGCKGKAGALHCGKPTILSNRLEPGGLFTFSQSCAAGE